MVQRNPRVTVIDATRRCVDFPNLDAAIIASLGDLRHTTLYYVSRLNSEHRLRFLDDDGLPIGISRIFGRIENIRANAGKPLLFFRDGPVHRTGKRSYRTSYRAPHTMNERRATASWRNDLAEEPDLGLAPPARRRHLVSTWDDLPRSRQRNWKKQRCAQWK